MVRGEHALRALLEVVKPRGEEGFALLAVHALPHLQVQAREMVIIYKIKKYILMYIHCSHQTRVQAGESPARRLTDPDSVCSKL